MTTTSWVLRLYERALRQETVVAIARNYGLAYYTDEEETQAALRCDRVRLWLTGRLKEEDE